jgi:PEGA domain
VPPGKYKLKVWHEKLGDLEQEVTVTAGQTTDVNFSYKKAKQ